MDTDGDVSTTDQPARRRKRTVFTAAQKEGLEAAFRDGLQSTAAENQPALSEVAQSLGLDVDVVKVATELVPC